MFLVVCYDISDEKRLRKVAKVMEGFGERVQLSVFECELSERQFQRMLEKVRAVMDEKEDRLRVYRLCGPCRRARQAYGASEVSDPPPYLIA